MIITNELLVKSARKLVYASLNVDIKQINTLMISNNVSMIPIIPGGKSNLAKPFAQAQKSFVLENEKVPVWKDKNTARVLTSLRGGGIALRPPVNT